MVLEYRIPMLVSSDPNNGAKNISSDGSRFDLFFERPIIIPKNAKNCYIVNQESTIWWTVPNIVTDVNDTFQLTYFDGFLIFPFTVVLPQGLYSLADLDDAINRDLVNQGAPPNLITITGDNATQKSIIQINVLAPATISIDFTIAQSIRDILGFDSQVIPAQSGIISIFSENVANFNTIDYFLIHTDLVSRGLRINDSYSSTIAQVLIDVQPGSQIVSKPFNPPPIPANELIGSRHSKATFWLTDQADNEVNTNGEIWSSRFVIYYTIPEDPHHKRNIE